MALPLIFVAAAAAVGVAVASSGAPPKPSKRRSFFVAMAQAVLSGQPLAPVGPGERFVFAPPPASEIPRAPNDLPLVIYPPQAAGLPEVPAYYGVDLGGNPWLWIGPGTMLPMLREGGKLWRETSWGSDTPSFWDRVVTFVTDQVMPTLFKVGIAVAGAAVGGVGGVLTAAALSAVAKIAAGVPITEAVANSVWERLPSAIARTTYFDTYRQLASVPTARKALEDARAAIVAKFGGSAEAAAGQLEAFDAGAAIGRAQRIQKYLIEQIKVRADRPDVAKGVDKAAELGVPLVEWISAYGGPEAAKLFGRLLALATQFVDAGEPGGVFDPAKPVTPRP